jgi:hypothetical protein
MPLMIYGVIRVIDPFFMTGTVLDHFVLLLLFINAVAPAVSMMIMARYGMISDLHLKNRTERSAPYLLVIFYYSISLLLLWWKDPGLPGFIPNFFGAIILSLAAALLINLRWKISMHMIAQGGALGAFIALRADVPRGMTFVVVGALLVAGIVGFARLHLNAHSHSQIYAGYFAGLVINLGTLTLI